MVRLLIRSVSVPLLAVSVFALAPAAWTATAADRCTIAGTSGADVLVGTDGSDVLCGRGGADLLTGRAGDDLLLGGPGADRLNGGTGNDRLRGGSGTDSIVGGKGSDHIDGGNGADVCLSAFDRTPGNDVVVGGAGRDAFVADHGDPVTGANTSRPCTIRALLVGDRKGPSGSLAVNGVSESGAPASWCWQTSPRSSYCADTAIDFSHLPSLDVPRDAALFVRGNADSAGAELWTPTDGSYPHSRVATLDVRRGSDALRVPPGRYFLALTGHWERGIATYWFELDVG
jgi:hypothetical protein